MLTDVARREAARPVRIVGSRSRRGWAVVAAAGVLASAVVALAPILADGRALLRPAGFTAVGEFLAATLHPRVDAEFLVITARAATTTLGYAVLGTALSLLIGVLGGVAASRTWWRMGGHGGGGRRAVTRAALIVPRGIHEVVWGLFLLSVLGVAPIVAVLAIAVPFGAITATVFADILDDTDPRPAAALRAQGAGRIATFCYGVLPAAAGELTSYSFYRFECAIRSAAVLGLVGAGGLGFELALSFAALRLDEIATLLFALIVLAVVADQWGSTVRARLAARPGPARRGRDPVLVGSLLAAVAAVPAAAWWIGLDLAPLVDARSWELAGELFAASWPPTLGAGPSGPGGSGAGGWAGLGGLALATLAMSVLAITIAFLAGLAMAAPAARPDPAPGPARAARAVAAAGVRLLLVVLRAVPPPVWALLTLFVLAPGTLAGAVALGIYTAGVLGRLMSETVENLDRRPSRALRALGASGPAVFGYAVLPAAAPRFAGYGLYRWEVTIRETVVVGVVGAGGLGMLLQTQLTLFDYAGAVTTIGTLLVLTVLVDLVSAAVRGAIR